MRRIAQATSLSGRERIVAYAPPGAEPLRLAAIVGVDAATAAAISESDGLRPWLIVSSSLLAPLLEMVFGRRLFNRPVARLLETAARWRGGDLSARSELRRDFSEFGPLAAAFDSMAATSRQAREHALNMALESTLDAIVVFIRGDTLGATLETFAAVWGAKPDRPGRSRPFGRRWGWRCWR
jgi:methyl-accepting chemotaxis protein